MKTEVRDDAFAEYYDRSSSEQTYDFSPHKLVDRVRANRGKMRHAMSAYKPKPDLSGYFNVEYADGRGRRPISAPGRRCRHQSLERHLESVDDYGSDKGRYARDDVYEQAMRRRTSAQGRPRSQQARNRQRHMPSAYAVRKPYVHVGPYQRKSFDDDFATGTIWTDLSRAWPEAREPPQHPNKYRFEPGAVLRSTSAKPYGSRGTRPGAYRILVTSENVLTTERRRPHSAAEYFRMRAESGRASSPPRRPGKEFRDAMRFTHPASRGSPHGGGLSKSFGPSPRRPSYDGPGRRPYSASSVGGPRARRNMRTMTPPRRPSSVQHAHRLEEAAFGERLNTGRGRVPYDARDRRMSSADARDQRMRIMDEADDWGYFDNSRDAFDPVNAQGLAAAKSQAEIFEDENLGRLMILCHMNTFAAHMLRFSLPTRGLRRELIDDSCLWPLFNICLKLREHLNIKRTSSAATVVLFPGEIKMLKRLEALIGKPILIEDDILTVCKLSLQVLAQNVIPRYVLKSVDEGYLRAFLIEHMQRYVQAVTPAGSMATHGQRIVSVAETSYLPIAVLDVKDEDDLSASALHANTICGAYMRKFFKQQGRREDATTDVRAPLAFPWPLDPHSAAISAFNASLARSGAAACVLHENSGGKPRYVKMRKGEVSNAILLGRLSQAAKLVVLVFVPEDRSGRKVVDGCYFDESAIERALAFLEIACAETRVPLVSRPDMPVADDRTPPVKRGPAELKSTAMKTLWGMLNGVVQHEVALSKGQRTDPCAQHSPAGTPPMSPRPHPPSSPVPSGMTSPSILKKRESPNYRHNTTRHVVFS